MTPSTADTATSGGFICGGAGGVGSVKWGVRELGNIIRLRVVTMQARPRVLEFTGEDLARVSHAHGTNGVITEIELRLGPTYDWTHCFIRLTDFTQAAQLAVELALQDGMLLKLATICEASIAARYFQRFRGPCRGR